MYPDIFDVRREKHRLAGGDQINASAILPDVVLSREFLYQAHHFCRNHGRHRWVPANQLLHDTEKYLGRTLSVQGFALALLFGFKIMPNAYTLDPTRLESIVVEFPPIDRFGECSKWNERKQEVEDELNFKG